MRTTLTLDEDIAAKLKAETRRTGKSFRDIVNECLRRGLIGRPKRASKTFKVRVRDLGALRPGVTLNNIAELLERIEGPGPR